MSQYLILYLPQKNKHIKRSSTMISGNITFKCDECKHRFRGPRIEYMATALSYPLKCPYCGSYHTLPWSLFDYSVKRIYKKIWADRDLYEKEKQQNQQSK